MTNYIFYERRGRQQIYRNKVVYIAESKPLIKKGFDKITRRYDDEDLSKHLTMETSRQPHLVTDFLTPYLMYFNKIFVLSILKLSHDIQQSVLRQTDGYWDMLANNSIVGGKSLQDNLEDAVIDIYDPKNKNIMLKIAFVPIIFLYIFIKIVSEYFYEDHFTST